MKKLLFLFLLPGSQLLYGQFTCDNFCLYFEDTTCMSQFGIDTVTYPGNIWQIAVPQKPSFNTVPSPVHAIVTDSINPYPVNNYSAFTFWNLATMGDIYGFRFMQGSYNVQTDSLHDFGSIEFSPDLGTTWIDIVNDTVYHAFIWYNVPVLTGNSGGWKNFNALLTDLGSVFNIHLGDTLYYRFTFTSDSIAENLGGLMYDDICFADFVEGITETRFRPVRSKIFPNPSSDIFTIEYENPDNDPFELAIYDIRSHLVMKQENISESRIIFGTKTLAPGIYIYKLTNKKVNERAWGKFISTR
jgi:hypothetical protein